MQKIILPIIRLYQLTLSPIFSSLGGGCRFYPSCSEYSKEAFKRLRWHRALFLSVRRILRCNPFSPGGLDPIK